MNTQVNPDLETRLSRLSFLEGLDPAHYAQIVDCASSATYEAGQFIVHEGEPAGHFYIVTHGKVALELHDPGRGTITIDMIEGDDVLGWSWLFPPYRWHFDARALELTRAIVFDARCLRGKMDEDHTLGYELVKRFSKVIVSRLQATRLRLVDVYSTSK